MPERHGIIDLREEPYAERRRRVQTVLARCYVAVAEMDHDLARWREEVENPMQVIDLRSPRWSWSTAHRGRSVETLQVTL